MFPELQWRRTSHEIFLKKKKKRPPIFLSSDDNWNIILITVW